MSRANDTSATNLIDALYGAELVQFGAFEIEGAHVPYRLRLDLLPSYPAVLKAAAQAITELIETPLPDRLVCTHEAVALATLVSQSLNVPLVVHSGTLGNPARNLIGAYDIGHPALLISLTTDLPRGFIARLTSDAGGVGLRLTQWVSLIEVSHASELSHVAAVSLRDAAEQLAEQGELSAAMAARITG